MPSNDNIKIRIKNKKDSSLNWNSENPILLDGELGIESDTGLIKIGDGITTWDKLKYSNSTKAEQDSNGNLIIDHYATKTELTNISNSFNLSINEIENTFLTKTDAANTYVDLSTVQTISGAKTFTSALDAHEIITSSVTVANGAIKLAANNQAQLGSLGIYFQVGSISGSPTLTATQYAGNAATATNTTNDSAGNKIIDTYATKVELSNINEEIREMLGNSTANVYATATLID